MKITASGWTGCGHEAPAIPNGLGFPPWRPTRHPGRTMKAGFIKLYEDFTRIPLRLPLRPNS
jgi:hypothetical protein